MDKPYLIEKTIKFSNIMEFFPLISFTEYIFYKKKSIHRCIGYKIPLVGIPYTL